MTAERVGIRELRQNLSVYLRRVREGTRFIVTDHNEPVAELVPLTGDARERRWRELVEQYGIIEAKGSLDELPPPIGPYDPNATVSRDIIRERDSYYDEP